MDELTKSYIEQNLNSVSFDFINEVADEGSIRSQPYPTGITSVSFKIQSVEFRGQYYSESRGVYALEVEEYDKLLNYVSVETVESLTEHPEKMMKILITMQSGLQLSTYYRGYEFLYGGIKVENYRDSIPALLGLSRMS